MAYIMRPVQDSYGCGRCPSVAPFVGQKSYSGVAGIYVRPLSGVGRLGAVGMDTVWPANTQIQIKFQTKVFGPRTVPRPGGLGFAQLMNHTFRVVREVPASGLVVAHVIMEVTDKWKFTVPQNVRILVNNAASLYTAAGFTPLPGTTWNPLYGALPLHSEPESSPPASGGGSDAPLSARELATLVVANLRARGSGYSRDLMRSFQRAAGISVDGDYGPQTRSALLRYVSDVPTVASIRAGSGAASGGGGGGGGSSPTPTPTTTTSPTERPLAASEGIPLWGWIGIGLAAGAVVIGATAAVASRSQALSGLSLMGFGR